MFKKILAIGGTIAIAASLSLVAVAGAAEATHPVVAGTAVCNPDTQQFDITWRVTGDIGYASETATVVTERLSSDGEDSPVVTPSFVGAAVKGEGFVEAVQANAVPGASYSLTVEVQWTNHDEGHLISQQSQPVTVSGTCATPADEDAVAEISTTAATCDVAAALILGRIDNASWGDIARDGDNYSVTATASEGHVFAAGMGVSDDGSTQTFEGVLDRQQTGEECVPTPECIPSSAVSYTYDGSTNSGVITVANEESDSGELCQGFWVTATSWKYKTGNMWPQSRDQVQYVNEKQKIEVAGEYPYQADMTCGQGDIYASFTEQPEPTAILSGPSDPYDEFFLHQMGFKGPGPTFFNQPTGCNEVVPVAPAVTTATECGVLSTVSAAVTTGIDYVVKFDTVTGDYVVTATPQPNYYFANDDDQVITFEGDAGGVIVCNEEPNATVAFGACSVDDEELPLTDRPTATSASSDDEFVSSRDVTLTFDNSKSTRPVLFTVFTFPKYDRTVASGKTDTVQILDSTVGKYDVKAAGRTFKLDIPTCGLPTLAQVTPTSSSTQPTCTAAGTYTLGSEVGEVVWTVNGVSGIRNGTYAAPANYAAVTITAAPARAGDGLDPDWENPVVLTFAAPTKVCTFDPPTLPLPPTTPTFNPPTLPFNPPTLAYTGAALGTGLSLAGGLLFVGFAGLVVAHRRKTQSKQHPSK
ncbi:hypothetical protein [Salinibacterium sp.]|uniref:hypothetical protein n=1 Tax=Salinibacterium sp. TaxID=1915057 RepID=UPI00286B0823|nr:hypothetical protein [Salinibacterium sp.]